MTLFVALACVPVVLIGAALAVVPWVVPPTECFTITIPRSAVHAPSVVRYRRGYAAVMFVVTLACVVGGAVVLRVAGASSLPVVILAGSFVPILASVALMLALRRRVRALKLDRGWSARQDVRMASVVEDAPQPLPSWTNLLYLPAILGLAAFGAINYGRFPDMLPMHAGLDGIVDSWEPKSPHAVFFPVVLAAVTAAVMACSSMVIVRSRRPVDPAAPSVSAYAYGAFARAESVTLLVCGLALTLFEGMGFYLALLGVVSLGDAGALTVVLAVAIVVAQVAIAIYYGQGGSRLARRMGAELGMTTAPDMPSDAEDARWKGGILYWNPDDPSIFVPKRFGVGWTVNLARPAGALLIALLIVVMLTSLALAWSAQG